MILGAGLLLLLGLGLLVAGVLTGVTALYWGCVVVCLIAAVLLVVVRRQMAGERQTAERVLTERGEERASSRRRPDDDGPPTWIPTAPQLPDPAPDPGPAVRPPAGATASGLAAEHPRSTEARQPEAGQPEVRQPEPRQPEPRHPEPRQPEVLHAEARRGSAPESAGEPPLEEVEVTDLLVVMDLRDEVLVIDEHPRYHLGSCRHLAGRETFPLPIDEARSDGFTPCGTCAPDRHLAQQARERKAGRRP